MIDFFLNACWMVCSSFNLVFLNGTAAPAFPFSGNAGFAAVHSKPAACKAKPANNTVYKGYPLVFLFTEQRFNTQFEGPATFRQKPAAVKKL